MMLFGGWNWEVAGNLQRTRLGENVEQLGGLAMDAPHVFGDVWVSGTCRDSSEYLFGIVVRIKYATHSKEALGFGDEPKAWEMTKIRDTSMIFASRIKLTSWLVVCLG